MKYTRAYRATELYVYYRRRDHRKIELNDGPSQNKKILHYTTHFSNTKHTKKIKTLMNQFKIIQIKTLLEVLFL